jgi:hypothetical protein
MDPDRVLAVGERGIHLLFETRMITEAFAQDADALRTAVDGRIEEIHEALRRIQGLPSAADGRRFVAGLDPAVRHILVLLYFELLDGRLRPHRVVH